MKNLQELSLSDLNVARQYCLGHLEHCENVINTTSAGGFLDESLRQKKVYYGLSELIEDEIRKRVQYLLIEKTIES